MENNMDLINDYLKQNSKACLYNFTNKVGKVKYKDTYYDEILFGVDLESNKLYSPIDNEEYALDLFLACLYPNQDGYGELPWYTEKGYADYKDAEIISGDDTILNYNLMMFRAGIASDINIDGYRFNKYIITNDSDERVAM